MTAPQAIKEGFKTTAIIVALLMLYGIAGACWRFLQRYGKRPAKPIEPKSNSCTCNLRSSHD